MTSKVKFYPCDNILKRLSKEHKERYRQHSVQRVLFQHSVLTTTIYHIPKNIFHKRSGSHMTFQHVNYIAKNHVTSTFSTQQLQRVLEFEHFYKNSFNPTARSQCKRSFFCSLKFIIIIPYCRTQLTFWTFSQIVQAQICTKSRLYPTNQGDT